MSIELLLKKLIDNKVLLSVREGKLLCKLPESGIGDDLFNALKSRKEEILAIMQERANFKKYQPISEVSKMDHYPLSPSQNRLWILSQLEGGSQAYNITFSGKFIGDFQQDIFEKSFKQVIEKHEVLRTSFKKSSETKEVRQFIIPAEKIVFKVEQLDFSLEEQPYASVENHLNNIEEQPIDLENAPLFRATLIKIAEQEYAFLFVIHHIICDGWSMEIFISEIVQNYNNLRLDKEHNLSPLKIQYKDYVAWLAEEVSKEKYQKTEQYWLDKFKGELPIIDLPGNKRRPSIHTFNGSSQSHIFSVAFSNKLKSFSEANNVTLFTTLMAGMKSLLSRYTGQDDFIVGTPMAARVHPDLENQIGLYVNTLAIRTQFQPQFTFQELLKLEKQNLLEANEHQIYLFDDLVDKLKLKRDLSRSALFDVFIVFQNQSKLKLGNGARTISGLSFERLNFQKKASQFDISFYFSENEDRLELELEYNTDIYASAFIAKMFKYFEQLVSKAIDDENVPLNRINYMTAEEQLEVLKFSKKAAVNYPKDKTVIDLFEEQASKTPGNTAIYDTHNSYTYEEVKKKSDSIAAYLVQEVGDEKEPIGIVLERSADLLLILLGVLKSGKSYIPIDPNLPENRINYIVENSKAKVVVLNEAVIGEAMQYENIQLIDSEKLINHSQAVEVKQITKPLATDTAYIIYTSGSTGKPKGVEIGHQSITNLLTSFKVTPGMTTADILYAVTTYSFDMSVVEFFAPLISGATVFVADYETLSEPNLIIKDIEKVKPTILQATPSFYQMLFEAGWKGNENLKAIYGGDAINDAMAAQFIRSTKETWNMYGPTETTVYSTLRKIEAPHHASSIGQPLSNTQIYILDSELNIVPEGVTGKIFAAGDGLAKGYFLNEELTNERFIHNPHATEEDQLNGWTRIYDTGDLGRWLSDGHIEFLGRKDHQVKIRGNRIELREIENTLLSKETITQVVVIVVDITEAKEKELAAYFTAVKEENITDLIALLRQSLPDYMLPGYFVQLEEFPLNANGKVDRKMLPNPRETGISGKTEYVPPQNEIQEQLVTIWEQVLEWDQIGIKDDFFVLGGHSIKATKVMLEISRVFGVEINVKTMFTAPTIEDLAAQVSFMVKQKKTRSEINSLKEIEL